MKAKEIRELGLEERKQKLKEFQEELFNLNFQLSTNQLENTSRIKQKKNDIARIKTIINESR